MKNYELLHIVHPDLEGSLEKVVDKVKNLVKESGGNIVKEDIWGRRRLAYPIAKNDFGIYVILNFSLDKPEKLSSFEEELKHTEEIIRYLLVVAFEEKKEKKETAKKVTKEVKPKKKLDKKKEVVEKKKQKPKKEPEEKKGEDLSKKEDKERMKEIDKKLDEILGKE